MAGNRFAVPCRRIGSNAPRIFLIGKNRTGSSTVESWLRSEGYNHRAQAAGEALVDAWAEGDHQAIIDHVGRGGNVFQDLPYRLPGVYAVLDKSFPKSQFILTTRDSNAWYDAVLQFYSKTFGNGAVPTREQLFAATYHRPGWLWHAHQTIHQTPADDPFDRDILVGHFEQHNREVAAYFKDRPEAFLSVDVHAPDAREQVHSFVHKGRTAVLQPHVNHSQHAS